MLYEQQAASQCNLLLDINIDSAVISAVTPCPLGRLASALVFVTPCVGCSFAVRLTFLPAYALHNHVVAQCKHTLYFHMD